MSLPLVTTDQRLMAQISGQLDELIGILRPEPPAEPEPEATVSDDKPTPKAPVKKAATRKKVTGQ